MVWSSKWFSDWREVKLNRFPLDIGHNMYKMYVKEELQSTLISMLVETGQQKGCIFKKIYGSIQILKYPQESLTPSFSSSVNRGAFSLRQTKVAPPLRASVLAAQWKGSPSIQIAPRKIPRVALLGWLGSHAHHWANHCVSHCPGPDPGGRGAPPKSWGRKGLLPGGTAESSFQERGCGMCRMAAVPPPPSWGPWEELPEWFIIITAVLYRIPVWCWGLW